MDTSIERGVRWALPAGVLVVLGGLSAFGPISTDVLLPGLPALGQDLGATPSEVQLTLSVCLLGLAFGQIVAGVASDIYGRRLPVLVGLIGYLATSLGCAIAPGIVPLVGLRLMQGIAGGVGIAIARAVVRDRCSGPVAAQAYGALMVVAGLGPVLAPVLGGLLLKVTDWRGVFVVLAVVGFLLMLGVIRLVPESLPRSMRRPGAVRETATVFGTLIRDPGYVRPALACGFASAAVMAYIAGSPYVLERVHHLSAQQFSLLFAVIMVSGLAMRQVSVPLTRRRGPAAVLRLGLMGQLIGTVSALCLTVFAPVLVPLVIAFALAVGSAGAILPAAVSLAMEGHPGVAGSASGLLGFWQSLLSASVAPIVGIGGPQATVPMVATMVACSSSAVVVMLWPHSSVRGRPPLEVV